MLLLERPANGADFRMRYYNADGGEAEMCGNGARCFARYADRTAGPLQQLTFETPAGVIGAQLVGELVTLQMSEPNDLRLGLEMPVGGEKIRCRLCRQRRPACRRAGGEDRRHRCSVVRLGPAASSRCLPRAARTPISVEQRGPHRIAIRTYERGVEDETLACGTGVVATRDPFAANENVSGPIDVLVRGGDTLQRRFHPPGRPVSPRSR